MSYWSSHNCWSQSTGSAMSLCAFQAQRMAGGDHWLADEDLVAGGERIDHDEMEIDCYTAVWNAAK